MHGRGIKWVVAVHHAQESRRLFKCLGTETRHLQQSLAVFERAVLVAVLDNILRQRGIQSGNVSQQCGGRGVDINTHRVNAILDHRFQ